MRYLTVDDDYVANILLANKLADSTTLQESSEVVEIEETTSEHVCPVCESSLDEAISDDSWSACVDKILEAINEASAEVGEDLSEKSKCDDEDYDEELDDDEEKVVKPKK